jgi:hypothetical protein
MDADRFETLLRSVTVTRSRRSALWVLGAGAVSLLGWSGAAPASAHNARSECTGIKNRQKRKRCKDRATAHNARHAGVRVPSGSPAPTCTDGIQNGSETDVDCGGVCQRCANTRACRSQDDCASALCVSGLCQACTFSEGECGIDGDGSCECRTHNIATQPHVCTSRLPGETSDNCDHCPDDTFCVRTGLGDYTCFKPCGAG